MTTYFLLFLIVSCVGQKNDNSNVGFGNVPEKVNNIGIPIRGDPEKKFDGAGNLKKDIIVTLTNGDVLNKYNSNIGFGSVPGKDINIGIPIRGDPLKKFDGAGNIKKDIIVALTNGDVINKYNSNIGFGNVPEKDINIGIPIGGDPEKKFDGAGNLKKDIIVTLTNGDVLNKFNSNIGFENVINIGIPIGGNPEKKIDGAGNLKKDIVVTLTNGAVLNKYNSNIGFGNIPEKDINIGIPIRGDPLKKFDGAGNLKKDIIVALTNGDVVNKYNSNIGFGNVPGKDINIGIPIGGDPEKKFDGAGNLKKDIIVTLTNGDVLNKFNSNIGFENVPGKDINIGIPIRGNPEKKIDGAGNIKKDIIAVLTNGDDPQKKFDGAGNLKSDIIVNKNKEAKTDGRVNNGVYFNIFGKDIGSKYIGSTLQKLNDIKLSFDDNKEPVYENYYYNRYDENEYKFEFDEGNPDVNEKIERPCEVYDTFCIRRFFAQHSKCKITGGPVPDPLFRPQVTVTYPRVDISATQTNAEYRGLGNARVEEFYINKATENLIITLAFDKISNFANNTYRQFYLRGREPVVIRDFAGLIFEKLSITVIIPQLDDLRLDKAEITTYANVPVFPVVTGPRVVESKDPEVLAKFAVFIADLPTNQQEILLTEGSFYAATYIQYNICDFGLKVL